MPVPPTHLSEADQFNWLLTHKMRNDDAKLSQLKESVDTNGSYINCDFIQGTAVENESIWSIATNILCNNRAGMTPAWLETILFIKNIIKTFGRKKKIVYEGITESQEKRSGEK